MKKSVAMQKKAAKGKPKKARKVEHPAPEPPVVAPPEPVKAPEPPKPPAPPVEKPIHGSTNLDGSLNL